jgi:hypothetical protein
MRRGPQKGDGVVARHKRADCVGCGERKLKVNMQVLTQEEAGSKFMGARRCATCVAENKLPTHLPHNDQVERAKLYAGKKEERKEEKKAKKKAAQTLQKGLGRGGPRGRAERGGV